MTSHRSGRSLPWATYLLLICEDSYPLHKRQSAKWLGITPNGQARHTSLPGGVTPAQYEKMYKFFYTYDHSESSHDDGNDDDKEVKKAQMTLGKWVKAIWRPSDLTANYLKRVGVNESMWYRQLVLNAMKLKKATFDDAKSEVEKGAEPNMIDYFYRCDKAIAKNLLGPAAFVHNEEGAELKEDAVDAVRYLYELNWEYARRNYRTSKSSTMFVGTNRKSGRSTLNGVSENYDAENSMSRRLESSSNGGRNSLNRRASEVSITRDETSLTVALRPIKEEKMPREDRTSSTIQHSSFSQVGGASRAQARPNRIRSPTPFVWERNDESESMQENEDRIIDGEIMNMKIEVLRLERDTAVAQARFERLKKERYLNKLKKLLWKRN